MLKCLQCLAEYKMAQKKANGSGTVVDLDSVNDAVTMAPSWQLQSMMGQTVMACVPLPTCSDHLEVGDPNAAQRAAGSGLLLGGIG